MKTASNTVNQKTAEATGDLIGNKIITKITKNSPQHISEAHLQTEGAAETVYMVFTTEGFFISIYRKLA